MAESPPFAELAQLFTRAGRLRGYAAVLLSLGGVLLFWRVVFMPLTTPVPPAGSWLPQTIVSIVFNLAALQTLARFFARKPRMYTREVTEHAGAVRALSARFLLKPPKILVTRSRYLPPIGIRGWHGDVAVVITTKTFVRWNQSADTRQVNLTHELAHIWARDLRLYYWTRSLSVTSALFLILLAGLFAWNGDNAATLARFALKIFVLAGLTLLAGRAYLRFREHVADISASIAMDEVGKFRAELIDTKDQTVLGRIIGTHPSPAARRAALFNPMLLLKSQRWSFLLLGLATGFFTSTLTYFFLPVARGARMADPVAPWAAAGVSAVLLAAILPTTLTEQFVFLSRSIYDTVRHCVLLFIGTVVGLLFLNPLQLIPGKGVQPTPWLVMLSIVLVAAVLTTTGCLIVILTADDGRPRVRSTFVFRAITLAAAVGTMSAPGYLFVA